MKQIEIKATIGIDEEDAAKCSRKCDFYLRSKPDPACVLFSYNIYDDKRLEQCKKATESGKI